MPFFFFFVNCIFSLSPTQKSYVKDVFFMTFLQFFVFYYQVCQRLMVQGLPGTAYCSGPFDVVHKVMKAEGFRGMYRGFGLTAVTQSPAYALWWGVYGAAQHMIWRYFNVP